MPTRMLQFALRYVVITLVCIVGDCVTAFCYAEMLLDVLPQWIVIIPGSWVDATISRLVARH